MVTTDVYAVPSKQVQDVFAGEASGEGAVAVRAAADTRAVVLGPGGAGIARPGRGLIQNLMQGL